MDTLTYLTADLVFQTAEDDDFDAFADRILDTLLDLEEQDDGIVDPDSAGNLTKRSLTISMGVKASTVQDAERIFIANVRTALLAAECETSLLGRYPKPTVRQVDAACA
ncbi:hypothetical protein [Nocardiopsis sp. NRRL B-16309]|uniref:hypothetical protein n=1 Tax=Nocardiopsis sp. NRRL B-16309 TaxID=1519494 RepID=UPI0006C25EF6|nr:hypothetical protein ADL05_15480 [Nocardiopsis sp. NRRL B-16309]